MNPVATLALVPGRLDKTLRNAFPDWGRRAVGEVIAAKHVRVNGHAVWLASWMVQPGDRIEVHHPPGALPTGPSAFDDAWLIHIDEDIVVVDKPSGLRAEGTRAEDRSANLLSLCALRFGDVTLTHRLDRDTSGVLVLARTRVARQALDEAFKSHSLEKHYVAVVQAPNRLADSGRISLSLAPDPRRHDRMIAVDAGGKAARTRYRVASRGELSDVVDLWPATGRTHQLRVHCAALGAPILGDRLYGSAASAPRMMLHAHSLEVPTIGGSAARTFLAQLPPGFVAG